MKKADIDRILKEAKTIAVVGLSRDPSKDSYPIAEYMKNHGYRIIPVNPIADEILGEKSYKSLTEIPEDIQKRIDIVDIFRPSNEVHKIVEQAIALRRRHGKPSIIWMQVDIVNQDAAKKAEAAGFEVVMNRCIRVEHRLRSHH
ncbi:MAG: CoA-binding protein [Thaumarchaeota archaeon]|nr:CoA-binding protein [Nitrososphaerota archaeon]